MLRENMPINNPETMLRTTGEIKPTHTDLEILEPKTKLDSTLHATIDGIKWIPKKENRTPPLVKKRSGTLNRYGNIASKTPMKAAISHILAQGNCFTNTSIHVQRSG